MNPWSFCHEGWLSGLNCTALGSLLCRLSSLLLGPFSLRVSRLPETLCWPEKSIFASSLSLPDCVVETTELWWRQQSCGKCFTFLLTWVQFTEITQLLAEFFVVKDQLMDGFLFLLDDQALTTDKGPSMQRVWHGACNVDRCSVLCTKLMVMWGRG